MATQTQGMVERRGAGLWLTHLFMITGVLIIFFPIWLAFVASTVTQPDIVSPPPVWPGGHFWENYSSALFSGVNVPVARMLMNNLIMAVGIAVGKIAISLISAFAIVYFRFPGRSFFFWTIFLTLMLPVEVRIVPTFEVVAGFGMLNSYYGLIFPLLPRRPPLPVPAVLHDHPGRTGGSSTGGWRQADALLLDIVVPMSRTNVAALFVILFIYGWNQYLWPLLITTDPEMNTIVMGIKQMFRPVMILPTGR